MIIYADIIRKFEVWVEIQADNVSPSTVELSSRRKAEVVPTTVDVFTERKETVTWSSPADGQRMYRHRPVSEAVNFTLGHEETSIGLPTAEAPDEVEGGLTPEEAPNTVDLPDPDCILDQATDGSRPKKAWKRQQLGWAGAVQTMFGHRKMRHAEDIPPGVLAYEKPERRKTVTL
ncbi:hypothetical protein P8C59_006216 [Phyllachora maydis]|uniref:Uncharacterized protein n=1 Tax=Phyllachora maydis TaxID=1825666 RepID=A0AAD9MD13_9PEZI|nr:hypothetical protein P8C59_006216 [Phyllachora maydis]